MHRGDPRVRDVWSWGVGALGVAKVGRVVADVAHEALVGSRHGGEFAATFQKLCPQNL